MHSNSAGSSSGARRSSARAGRAAALLILAGALGASSVALAQELDPDLQFVLDNGFESFIFAQTCRSTGPGGDVIEGESLPVGDGRVLECETFPFGHQQVIDLQASTGELHCVLGQLSSVTPENVDPRLSVSVVSTPDGAPWVLEATSATPITITRVAGPGGSAFPLAADALFDVVEIRPNPNAAFCPDLFGL